MMPTTRMLDHPGSGVRLTRDIEETADRHLELAELALAAMFTLSNELCLPLSIELASSYWDDACDMPVHNPSPTHEFAMLRRDPLPDQVEAKPHWLGETVSSAQELDFATSLRFVRDFLTPRPGDATRLPLGWQWIEMNASMVRLPSGFQEREYDMVPVAIGNGSVDHPVVTADGSDWVYGPMGPSVLHAPFEYRLHRNPGQLVFDISIYWSTWIEKAIGGRTTVTRARRTDAKE